MTALSNLSTAKIDLVQAGQTELELTHVNSAVQEYWLKRQQLMDQQNADLAAAIQKVLADHQSSIAELEDEYAMYLHMIKPSGDSQ